MDGLCGNEHVSSVALSIVGKLRSTAFIWGPELAFEKKTRHRSSITHLIFFSHYAAPQTDGLCGNERVSSVALYIVGKLQSTASIWGPERSIWRKTRRRSRAITYLTFFFHYAAPQMDGLCGNERVSGIALYIVRKLRLIALIWGPEHTIWIRSRHTRWDVNSSPRFFPL